MEAVAPSGIAPCSEVLHPQGRIRKRLLLTSRFRPRVASSHPIHKSRAAILHAGLDNDRPVPARCVHQIAQMSAKGNRVEITSDAGPPAPGTKDAARHSAPLPTPQAESRSAPPPTAQTARHDSGSCPDRLPGRLFRLPSRNSRHSRAVGLYQSSNSHTASRQFHPAQTATALDQFLDQAQLR